jgi:beta-N-acetylhexosaminidase
MGININIAPVLDVLANPKNSMLGTRSFGSDPALVSRLGAALVEGLQSAGVAAVIKHFPGLGDARLEAHAGVAIVPHAAPRLRQVELPPFEAAIRAGAKLVMAAHVAVPALNNGLDLPATLSPAILNDLLRGEMGFDGLVITDALDMQALGHGSGLANESIAAFAAGVDILLISLQAKERETLYTGLLQAARDGLLGSHELKASARRVLALKSWLAGQVQPPLEVVGCAEHQAVALETARRSVALVWDATGLLPLHMRPGERLLVLTPQPADLAPTETSSTTRMTLANEIRCRHAETSWLTVPSNPSFTEITAILERAGSHALVIIGTFNAVDLPGQIDLVRALLASGVPTVIAAMRTPFDLLAFPGAPTTLCTCGIQPVSMQALAEALFGEIPFQGRLPVALPER